MVNTVALRKMMRKKKLTVSQAAATVGVDESTFYRKLAANCATFTLEQAEKLSTALALPPDDAQRIFFYQPDQTA